MQEIWAAAKLGADTRRLIFFFKSPVRFLISLFCLSLSLFCQEKVGSRFATAKSG